MKIAIVGASGVIGRSFLDLLEQQSDIQGHQLHLLTSSQSAGQSVHFRQSILVYENLSSFDFSQVDVCFFATDASVSKIYIPLAQAHCQLIIDNSSAFRYNPDVALVIPEINFQDIKHFKNQQLVANPNCTTIGLFMALAPIHRHMGIKRMDVATYQSISGAGQAAVDHFCQDLNQSAIDPENPPKALDVVAKIDDMECNGYSKEELKIHRESRKILNCKHLIVSATCVRVPVIRGHAAAVSIELDKPCPIEDIETLLKRAPGVIFDPEPHITPRQHAHQESLVHVSRLRADIDCPKRFHCWVVSDNILRGGSYNAFMIFQYWLHEQNNKAQQNQTEPQAATVS